jgi:hypothetical protein
MLEMIRTPDTVRNDCPQVRRSVNVLPTISSRRDLRLTSGDHQHWRDYPNLHTLESAEINVINASASTFRRACTSRRLAARRGIRREFCCRSSALARPASAARSAGYSHPRATDRSMGRCSRGLGDNAGSLPKLGPRRTWPIWADKSQFDPERK